MGVYLHNPGKAPKTFGTMVFPPDNYTVVTPEVAARLEPVNNGLQIEGQPGFPPLWVRNTPELKTGGTS